MVTYVAIYVMFIVLALILGINRLTTLSLSNTRDEMRLIKSQYAAQNGARWFNTYCESNNKWDYRENLDIGVYDDNHIYILNPIQELQNLNM